MSEGRIPDNPTIGVVRQRIKKTAGYTTWSEQHIARLEARWPIGTKQRLAIALVLFTGLRRGDAVKAGPGHVHNEVLSLRQSKTGGALDIPVHPELRRVLDATPSIGQTFLTTRQGKPYTAPGFGNFFRELANAAECGDISAHGGRKATARRLAELGCSVHQIAAITGHATLAEVERYTREADRARLAREGMAKMPGVAGT